MPEKVVKVGTSQLQVTSTPVCSAGEGGGREKDKLVCCNRIQSSTVTV